MQNYKKYIDQAMYHTNRGTSLFDNATTVEEHEKGIHEIEQAIKIYKMLSSCALTDFAMQNVKQALGQ